MKKTLEAIYENGVFKPMIKLSICEHQKVMLIVETSFMTKIDKVLDIAMSVYDGLSDKQVDEVEEISLMRNEFFSPRHES